MFEANLGGNLLEFGGREPTAVGCSDERAYAGASDKLNGNLFFFQNFEDADVGDASGETSA
jgi:hypothetical protein